MAKIPTPQRQVQATTSTGAVPLQNNLQQQVMTPNISNVRMQATDIYDPRGDMAMAQSMKDLGGVVANIATSMKRKQEAIQTQKEINSVNAFFKDVEESGKMNPSTDYWRVGEDRAKEYRDSLKERLPRSIRDDVLTKFDTRRQSALIHNMAISNAQLAGEQSRVLSEARDTEAKNIINADIRSGEHLIDSATIMYGNLTEALTNSIIRDPKMLERQETQNKSYIALAMEATIEKNPQAVLDALSDPRGQKLIEADDVVKLQKAASNKIKSLEEHARVQVSKNYKEVLADQFINDAYDPTMENKIRNDDRLTPSQKKTHLATNREVEKNWVEGVYLRKGLTDEQIEETQLVDLKRLIGANPEQAIRMQNAIIDAQQKREDLRLNDPMGYWKNKPEVALEIVNGNYSGAIDLASEYHLKDTGLPLNKVLDNDTVKSLTTEYNNIPPVQTATKYEDTIRINKSRRLFYQGIQDRYQDKAPMVLSQLAESSDNYRLGAEAQNYINLSRQYKGDAGRVQAEMEVFNRNLDMFQIKNQQDRTEFNAIRENVIGSMEKFINRYYTASIGAEEMDRLVDQAANYVIGTYGPDKAETNSTDSSKVLESFLGGKVYSSDEDGNGHFLIHDRQGIGNTEIKNGINRTTKDIIENKLDKNELVKSLATMSGYRAYLDSQGLPMTADNAALVAKIESELRENLSNNIMLISDPDSRDVHAYLKVEGVGDPILLRDGDGDIIKYSTGEIFENTRELQPRVQARRR